MAVYFMLILLVLSTHTGTNDYSVMDMRKSLSPQSFYLSTLGSGSGFGTKGKRTLKGFSCHIPSL